MNSLIHFNDIFPNVYVINLTPQTERFEHFQKEAAKFNIKYERFAGIDANDIKRMYPDAANKHPLALGKMGCMHSHKGCIELAKEKGFKNVAVFEDDAIFSDDFAEKFDKAYRELVEYDPNWNYFQIGYDHWRWEGKSKENTHVYVTDHITKIKNACGPFCYAVVETAYDTYIDFCSRAKYRHFDTYISHHGFYTQQTIHAYGFGGHAFNGKIVSHRKIGESNTSPFNRNV